MRIDSTDINKHSKVSIIAELSANHNGSLQVAKETVRAEESRS
jgi:pseudaminic acid synthase